MKQRIFILALMLLAPGAYFVNAMEEQTPTEEQQWAYRMSLPSLKETIEDSLRGFGYLKEVNPYLYQYLKPHVKSILEQRFGREKVQQFLDENPGRF